MPLPQAVRQSRTSPSVQPAQSSSTSPLQSSSTPFPQVSGRTRSAVQPRHWLPEQSSTPAPHSVSQARERPSSHPKQPSSICPLQSSSTALPQTSIDSVRTLHRKTPPRQRATPAPQAVVQGCSAPSTQVSA